MLARLADFLGAYFTDFGVRVIHRSRPSVSCVNVRRGQVCALCVCLSLLMGCGGGGGHTQSLDGVAAMKITRRVPGTLIEEGPLKGAFNGWLVMHIDTQSSAITKLTIRNRSGEMTGSATTAGSFNVGARTALFRSSGKVTAGTGSFAHVRPSVIKVRTFDDWLRGSIQSTVTGKVSY
jgi:hypothetical protein